LPYDDRTDVYLWEEGEDVDYEEEFDGEVLNSKLLVLVAKGAREAGMMELWV